MSRPESEKCRRCSKLSALEARQRYECWSDEKNRCNMRRSCYRSRDRYNQSRRQKYHATLGQLSPIEVVPPEVPAMVLQFYRERKCVPLHALGVEQWIDQYKRAVKVAASFEPLLQYLKQVQINPPQPSHCWT